MACRLAGGIDSPEKLWQAMLEKKDLSGEIPSKRWDVYRGRDVRNAKELDKATTRGYFVDALEDFDAAFFGVSPIEAEQMDPQQRLALEVSWEALEDAGIPPQSLSQSDTAVFMGVNSDDYSKLLLEDLPGIEAWMGIGTAFCGVPNRISYHMDLMGPSTAVDAACASSLVAIHHGRQAIRQGESKIAIAGGVNALCGPGLTRVLDKAGAVSHDGSCMSFDDGAHGYGRGEGAAIVILKGLANAVADGDHILAVLKGSAVAQDGHTNGIMAPNGKAQELVAHKALKAGGLEASRIQYVEAHATSTPLGDPTEVTAIANVYGSGRSPKNPVLIGSVKPNVGHLEGGAGAVGFIKAVMAVNNGILPPQANLKKLNTKIDWKESGVKVVQETTEWPAGFDKRRAAICSYGYGGTVSHAVIEAHSQYSQSLSEIEESDEASAFPTVLLISAPQERRMAVQAAKQASWISSSGKEHDLRAIATTLAMRRGHHDSRVALVVDNHEDAVTAFNTVANGSANEWTAHDRVLDSNANKGVVWVFSGHGAQWKEMGRDLLHVPLFRQAVAALDHIIEPEMGFSAIQALQDGDFDVSDKIQVLTYAMQIGLSTILREKGVNPQAVIGHSVGEIAASVSAGALTVEEGALIVCRRAVLYRRVMGLGLMIFVKIPFSQVESELRGREDIVAAIDSSPSSCVVSGESNAIAELEKSLKTRGIKTFRVRTDVAFHSPMLKELVSPLQMALADSLHPQPPTVRLYSSSDPEPRTKGLRDIDYWTNNMVKPVLLTSAVNAAAEDGFRLFLEVSSHPIVSQSISETLMDKGIEEFSVFSTMERKKPAKKSIQFGIAQLHCRGAHIEWEKQMGRNWVQDVLGTHWSHKPFWKHVESGPLNASVTHDVEKHNLLGKEVEVVGANTHLFMTQLDNNTKPFPGSHPLHGTEVVPAAVLINTFLNATRARSLSDISLRVPIAVSAQRDVQIVVHQDHIKIASTLTQDGGEHVGSASWVTHTTGSWSSEMSSAANDRQNLDIAAIRDRIGTKLADNFSIDYLDKVGVSAMGFPWAVTEHYGNLKEMIARVVIAPDVAEGEDLPWDSHSWAPLLDAATSVSSTLFFNDPKLRMPAQIDKVGVYTDGLPPKMGYLYVEQAPGAGLAVDVSILDESGEPLLKIFSMRFSEIQGTPGASGSIESLAHQLAWPPTTFSEKPLEIDNIVLISGHSPTEKNIADLSNKFASVIKLSQVQDLSRDDLSVTLKSKETIIVYCPDQIESIEDIPRASELFISEILDIVRFVAEHALPTKVFVLTNRTFAGEDLTALAQAPLHGLCRIIASELPDLWGALIDTEDSSFPLQAIKYVQGHDIIRMSDGVPRTARLRSFPRKTGSTGTNLKSLLPRPKGTYIITGGIGALGLEVADFLVEKSARRLVLVSRRELPPRGDWDNLTGSIGAAAQKIKHLENLGATVYVVAADIGAPSGSENLKNALDNLSLPPILGVVHAAGVLEDQLVLETTADSLHRVLRPKVAGALALHSLFAPGSLDFFVLFSSCGQLFGFPGQSSYASGNAFLDTLATHRRNLGDNAVAFQWTSWRGLGMAASTDFINAELESKGITDVTRDEAFRAWEYVANHDTDHAVVLRSLAFDENEPLPVPILNDIAVRRAGTAATTADAASPSDAVPASGPELKIWLDTKIRECVVSALQLSGIDDVDSRATLSDLGVDSVMTVTLRKGLQSSLKIKVPPTLTWSHPTVGHLVGWYMEKLGSGSG